MSRAGELSEHDATAATARALGVEPGSLASALEHAESWSAAWSALEPAERAVLQALAELGGAAPPSLVEAEAMRALQTAEAGASPADERAARVSAAEALDALWSRGFVQRDRATRDAWLVPELGAALVRRHVAELAAELDPVEPPPPPDPDEHLLLCAHALLRLEPVKLTLKGRPHRRSLDRIQAVLEPLLQGLEPEALLTDLRRQGLLRLVDGSLQACESAAEEWAAADRHRRASRLLASEWGGPDAPLLLRQLAALADARWPTEVSRRTWRRLLLRTGLSEASDADERHDRAASVLAAAGLVARDRTDGSLALTALGRSWPEPFEEPTGPTGVFIGNDLAVLVPRGLSATVHLRVSRAARLEVGDVVARYRLERDAVLSALDAGEHADELLAFLEARAEPALPEAVREDLKRWCERFGEVSSHSGIAVACEVPGRRAEFEALVARCGLRARRIAPGVAVVASDDHAALLDELVAAGFTPRRRVLEPRPPAGAARRSPTGLEPSDDAAGAARADWPALPRWDAPAEAGRGRRATPPASTALARLKEKYRREFGRSELAALDLLEVEDLLEMEERGLTRRYLSGVDGPLDRGAPEVGFEEHEGGELVPTSPKRAAAVLARCAEEGRRCELAWRGDAGRRRVGTALPLALVEEAGIRYARLKLGPAGDERLLAVDRILALRVISTRS